MLLIDISSHQKIKAYNQEAKQYIFYKKDRLFFFYCNFFIVKKRAMKIKTSKSENTKQLIIEKTASVFNTKGYAGTSINDLMNVTGLSKGCIYGNFENKDEIALKVFDYNFAKITQHVKERILATGDSVEGLCAGNGEKYSDPDIIDSAKGRFVLQDTCYCVEWNRFAAKSFFK